MKYLIKILLFPFSIIYGLINSLINLLYNRRIFKYTQFDIPVISVGNLTVGGTGKTPLVEYLIELLKPKYKVSTLSRGYGRKSQGFLLAGSEDTAYSLGDESFQIHKKYGEEVVVAVGEERVLAIPRILYTHPEVQVILLDDAFQHRPVKPVLQILLNDYNRPFYDDIPMPAGRLREFRSGANRADAVVVTKCPGTIGKKEQSAIIRRIQKYSGKDKPVYFTTIDYKEPVRMNSGSIEAVDNVVLLTGIANVAPLLTYVTKNYNLVKHFKYPDHHNYLQKDVDKVINYVHKVGKDIVVLTTEKDAVKLKPFFKDSDVQVFVLPIKVRFINREKEFQELVIDAATYKED